MKNISIGLKVMLPVIMLAFILAGTCYSNVASMDRMIKASEEISGNYAKSMFMLGDISTAFETLEKIAYAHSITSDDENMRKHEEEMGKICTEIDSICADYEKYLEFSNEKEAYNSFRELYATYLGIFEEAIKQSVDNNMIQALALVNGDLATAGSEVFAKISEMRDINQDYMDMAVDDSENTYKNARRASFALFAAAAVVAVLSVLICILGITKPIIKSSKELAVIIDGIESEKGDLTRRISVKGKDEIARMGGGINTFIQTLQTIMRKITNSSNALDKMAEEVKESVNTVNSNAYDISAAMEELSSSMEEVAATSSNVNDNASTVGDEVKELAEASKALSAYAEEMKQRAANIEKDAETNKKDASNVVEGILTSLRKAVENSKSVERVGDLTEEILSISAQTNLLALNASIEAARAGEIRELADSSRKTAGNIQNINNMVISAVNELVRNSDEIIKYLQESVLPAYENFLAGGIQYKEDAEHVNETVTHFSDMSANIDKLAGEIIEAMGGIAAAVDESANAVMTSASNTNGLVKVLEQISVKTDSNHKIAKQLKKEAGKFVNV